MTDQNQTSKQLEDILDTQSKQLEVILKNQNKIFSRLEEFNVMYNSSDENCF